jgi:NAD(P)H-flavin reductase/formate hydrogenlyase subunit 6/NADH:ubiquinone oxidoreductase subunit I
MFVLKKENLEALLNVWANKFEILAPQENDGQVMLLPYKNNNITMDYINLAFPVKEFVFKQKEKLFSWSSENGSLKVEPYYKAGNNKTILFGVRPCDAYGITYMDKFFLEGFKDDIYEANRKDLLIAAVNCTQPGDNCFCSSAGTGPFAKNGFDVLFTPIDDKFLVEAGSEKGEELIILGEELLSEAGKGLADEKDELEADVISKFNTILNTKNISEVLKDNFNNPIWEQLAKECVGCTGCTNVCPTCTCFNVVEEKTSACSGCRVRYWDSCQTSSFTRNAGEHNPRSNQARVRYRIYDKLKYIEEKFGMKGCTGCGRCINVCPASINMVNIVNRFADKEEMDVENKIEHLGHHAEHESCESVYTPQTAVITDIITETKNIKRFIMKYEDKTLHENFKFGGQFFEITVFGVGEIAISIPFSPSSKDSFDFCIKKAGKVTSAIHEMKVGDKVGLRGPFGKGFPYEELKGRDILIIGSGVGLAPVRTMILRVLENKKDFGKLVVIGSAISYEDLVYKEDLISWSGTDDVKVLYALSNPTSKVEAHVGYINDLLPDLGLDWKNTSAIICASPKRIKAVAKDLLSLGMKGTDILTSLETHMRCGIGKCGHCKVGNKYMCVDGPVFNYEEMLELPPEF